MKRVCVWPDCVTVLSAYNRGTFCWMHTPDEPRTPFVKVQRSMTEFVAGKPGSYEFTPEDRARSKRGE